MVQQAARQGWRLDSKPAIRGIARRREIFRFLEGCHRYNAAMRRALKLHPESRCRAATKIEVEAARPAPGSLVLRYVVTGRIADLRLPPAAAAARADELWRHSCFEAFVRAPPGAAYTELNFSPSMQWAAYRFDDTRSGMSVAREIAAPRVEVRSKAACYELRAALALDRVPDLAGDGAWRLGLSAVLEEAGGRKSYWALAHPPGEPDFHHSDCFELQLPAAWRP